MSDRTCPDCGCTLAGSWSMRGGHQPGSAACKVAKTARTMNEADYCRVSGADSVELLGKGVPVKYGFVDGPGVPNPLVGMVIAGSKRMVTAAFAPKHVVYLFRASQGLKLRSAIARAETDPDFRAAIIAVAELAGDEQAARQAIRTYLASECLL